MEEQQKCSAPASVAKATLLLLLPALLKGRFSEAEPSDPIPNLWIWAVARSFALRLLVSSCTGPGWRAAMPKLKTTQQQPDIGGIKRGKDPVNSSDPWPAQESRGDCSGISTCWLLPAAHPSRGVFVPVGWAAGRSCPGALWQEEGNSKLCHSEADLGGVCMKHQQLGSVPIRKTWLRSLAAFGEGSAGCWFLR